MSQQMASPMLAEVWPAWAPQCSNCAHWRRRAGHYDCCTLLNRRLGWGDLEFMPAGDDEWCASHEPKEAQHG